MRFAEHELVRTVRDKVSEMAMTEKHPPVVVFPTESAPAVVVLTTYPRRSWDTVINNLLDYYEPDFYIYVGEQSTIYVPVEDSDLIQERVNGGAHIADMEGSITQLMLVLIEWDGSKQVEVREVKEEDGQRVLAPEWEIVKGHAQIRFPDKW